MTSMPSSMTHDNDARTGTTTGIKNHIISLKNHLNMTNVMVSLKAPSASGDREHVICMYMPKTNMPHKCYIYTTYAD